MATVTELEKCFEGNDNVFDFISSSVSLLNNYLDDSKTRNTFVKDVGDDSSDLRDIREKVFSDFPSLFSFSNQIDYLRFVALDSCKDKSQEEQMAILYSVLLGINDSLNNRPDRSFNEWGPLDHNDNNEFRIYLRPQSTYLNSFIAGVDKERNIDKDHLLNSLNRFIFVETSELKLKSGDSMPKGILVNYTEDNWTKGKIRVGISPFCIEKNFEFDPPTALDPKQQYFTVTYPAKIDQERYIEIVKKILVRAVNNKCNIVVFAEYICSKQVKNAISETLYSLSFENQFMPDLVFAGTNWNSENKNELFVFDRSGSELGRYHKRKPFDSTLEDKVEWIEDLQGGWDDNTFFCLPNIGYIMPSICKDALISNGPSDMFSKLFSPLLIVVPAWSRSIESFKRLGNNIMDTFTSYIVADACSAIRETDKKKNKFGKGFIVTKDETVVGNMPVDVISENCNESNCDSGCLLVVDYDFTYKEGEDKKPITNTKIEQVELQTTL